MYTVKVIILYLIVGKTRNGLKSCKYKVCDYFLSFFQVNQRFFEYVQSSLFCRLWKKYTIGIDF